MPTPHRFTALLTLALLGSASALTVLPDTPQTRQALNLNLPAGGLTLSQTLTLIARAAKLNLVTRDLPQTPVTQNLSGLSVKSAIETLLNVYGDGLGAQLSGKTLIIAPQAVLDRLSGNAEVTRVIAASTTDTDAAKLQGLIPGVKVASFGPNTVLSGDSRSVTQAAELLSRLSPPPAANPPAPPADVTQTVNLNGTDGAPLLAAIKAVTPEVRAASALGQLVLNGHPDQVALAQGLALKLLGNQPQAAPASSAAKAVTRTLTSTLGVEAVTSAAQGLTPQVRVSPLPNGLFALTGTEGDLDTLTRALKDAEAQDRRRSTLTYAVTANGEDAVRVLSTMLPGTTVQYLANSKLLLVHGTPSAQAAAVAFLKGFDQPQGAAKPPPAPGSEMTSALIRLNHADAQTLAAQLRGMTDDKNPVTIIPDPRSQALLLRGSADALETLKAAAASLDQQLPDVKVTLRVEQVSNATSQALGLNWKLGIAGVNVGQQDGTLSVGYAPSLSPATIEAQLNLANAKGGSRTLLNTSFVVQTGRQSAFQQGGQLVVPTTQTSTQNGTTSTSSTASTYDYGLQVNLTPRLAADGSVEMQVVTNIGGKPSAGPNNSIAIDKQSLSTVVSLTPGTPVYLGGVVSDDASESSKGIPVLSELPVIGALFGSKTQSRSSSTILIILSAERVKGAALNATTPTGTQRADIPAGAP